MFVGVSIHRMRLRAIGVALLCVGLVPRAFGQSSELQNRLILAKSNAREREMACMKAITSSSRPDNITKLSEEFTGSARETLMRLESLRSHRVLDGEFFDLADGASRKLALLPALVSHIGDGIICHYLAIQYSDLIDSHERRQSKALLAARISQVNVCASDFHLLWTPRLPTVTSDAMRRQGILILRWLTTTSGFAARLINLTEDRKLRINTMIDGAPVPSIIMSWTSVWRRRELPS